MASKKSIKKDVNNMVYDVVDECFMAMMMNAQTTESAEKLIDEAAEFQDSMLEKINRANGKADYKSIRGEMEKAAITFVTKLNELA
jgi:hypothetical protein